MCANRCVYVQVLEHKVLALSFDVEWLVFALVSRASPSGWSDGSCLPERAWRGRRLSISAASTRTKRSSKLPVRNWRASFWQPNRLVINSAATNPLQFVYFHVFVLNWLQNRKKKISSLSERDFNAIMEQGGWCFLFLLLWNLPPVLFFTR